jgi:hypothetical protein
MLKIPIGTSKNALTKSHGELPKMHKMFLAHVSNLPKAKAKLICQ